MFEFKIPEVGDNIKSGTVVTIFVKPGDKVKKDQDLLELETDKASIPVPSPVDGVIKEIRVKEGQNVAIGAVVMTIDAAGASAPTSASAKSEAPKPSTPASQSMPTAESKSQPSYSPAAAQSIPVNTHEQSVDPSTIRVVVIGGGPGGYAAAFHSADLGMPTTLVDLDPNPGGVCLYRGCIPSKALLHAAKIMHEAKVAKEIGITFQEPKLDLDRLRNWKNQVVEQLTGGVGQLAKLRKVNFIQGRAIFLDSNTIEIEKAGGGKEKLSFDKVILATGSRPIIIPTWPKSPRIIDSTGALELKDIPKTMLLVGGGVIGLELGTVYAALGSQLDVVEMLPGLIPSADRDIVAVLEKRLKSIFRDIMLETKVTAMEERPSGILVKFEDKSGKNFEKEYEKVLVAIGRRPNSENLGLDKTKVKISDKGFVQVDDQLKTTDPSIFAIGDLVGQPMLAHKASHEGIVAAEVIAGHKVAFEPKTIPSVVYTDPEIAWCGLTETEAKAQGIEHEVAKFPWAASGRALTMARTDGLTKLLFDPKTEIILGMSVVGPGAGELIAEGVLAIEMSATATDIKLSIHPHPTITETIMESAESFYGHATHIYRPKKK